MRKLGFYGLFRHDRYGKDFLEHGAKYLGSRTVPGFTLWSTVDGRGVFARPAEDREVKVDMYEMPNELVVQYVDACEGHPYNYRRTEVKTTADEDCEIYVMQHEVEKHTIPVGSEWTPETIAAAQALNK